MRSGHKGAWIVSIIVAVGAGCSTWRPFEQRTIAVYNPHGGSAGMGKKETLPDTSYIQTTYSLCLRQGPPVDILRVDPVEVKGELGVVAWTTDDRATGLAQDVGHIPPALRASQVDRPCRAGSPGNRLTLELRRHGGPAYARGFRVTPSTGTPIIIPFRYEMCVKAEPECKAPGSAQNPDDEFRVDG